MWDAISKKINKKKILWVNIFVIYLRRASKPVITNIKKLLIWVIKIKFACLTKYSMKKLEEMTVEPSLSKDSLRNI